MGSSSSGRRKPREQKIIQGTFRRDRNPGNEPEPTKVRTIPPAPTSLGKTGRALWVRLATELVGARVLTVVDLPALEILCASYQVAVEAGHAVYHDAKGRRRSLAVYLRNRPPRFQGELQAMKAAWSAYRAYAIGFGLDPASRNRIDLPAPQKPEADDMERLLDRD